MENKILGISIDLRSDSATQVQNVLTKHGCIIRTRIGLHQQDNSMCSEKGIILLELNSDCRDECRQLKNDLSSIESVSVKEMKL